MKKEKLPKKQDKNAKLELPEGPKKLEVPEPTLMDIMREMKTLRNDVNVALEATKALGSDVLRGQQETAAVFTDFQMQIQELQRAFINVASQGFNAPATAQKQSNVGDLTKIKWTQKSWGDWAWANKRDGSPNPDTASLIAAINSSSQKAVLVDGMEYTLSKDGKFLNRRKPK